MGLALQNIRNMKTCLQAAFKVFQVIESSPVIRLDDIDSFNVRSIEKDIVFSSVSFTYKGASKPSLQRINLVIEHGKITALVGSSGSGKSTLIKLLERLYDPSLGTISVNGFDLKILNQRQYRHCIGYVGQEPVLLNESIKENLLNAKPDATDDEIYQALKSSMAYEFVSDLPDGIDTNVGAIGSKLSGGQKQRIAIARALIKKPSLLILDEATSALDTKSEQEVQEAIENINKEMKITTVVIAHRLSTIANADKIVIMGEGRIQKEVSYEELIKMEGLTYKYDLLEDDSTKLVQRVPSDCINQEVITRTFSSNTNNDDNDSSNLPHEDSSRMKVQDVDDISIWKVVRFLYSYSKNKSYVYTALV